MGTTIAIETLDGDGGFSAYLAEPEGTPKGAVVVIQEIFGVNEGIRRKCDHWAASAMSASRRTCSGGFSPGSSSIPTCPSSSRRRSG